MLKIKGYAEWIIIQLQHVDKGNWMKNKKVKILKFPLLSTFYVKKKGYGYILTLSIFQFFLIGIFLRNSFKKHAMYK